MRTRLIVIIFLMTIFGISMNLYHNGQLKERKDHLYSSTSDNLFSLLKNEKQFLLSNATYSSLKGGELLYKKILPLSKKVCTSDLTNVENVQYPDREVYADLKSGIFNCFKLRQKVEKNKEGVKLTQEELIDKVEIMVAKYDGYTKNLDYPADDSYQLSFYKLFRENLYLIDSISKNDKKLYSLVTLILGDSAIRASRDELFMVGPALLTSAITHDEENLFSYFAFVRLNEEIKAGFSGSGGTSLPQSWKDLLYRMAKAVKFSKKVNNPV